MTVGRIQTYGSTIYDMSKRVIIIAAAIVLAVAAGGDWYLVAHRARSNDNATGSGFVALSGSDSGKSIPLERDSQSKPGDLSVTNSGEGQLQLPGASPNPNDKSGSAQQQVDFNQFEQYKTAETTLYRDEVVGEGATASPGKAVAVNYRGWLTSGQLFDESTAKIKPFVFTPGEHKVIVGFELGLIGMKVGGKRLLIIPPKLGYGSQAMGPIPPNSVIVFQIELLQVQ